MKRILNELRRKDCHPLIQFLKYGVCGGLATAVDILVFYLLAWKLIPALGADDILVKLLGVEPGFVQEEFRSRNFIIAKSLAFLASNLTAYTTNVLFVFEGGKHQRHKEMTLFLIVSLVSFGTATLISGALIQYMGMQTTVPYVINIIASVMINYAGRKYLIFKG